MIDPIIIADDIRKTKVCYIEDIAKLYRLYEKEIISVKVFDILYDMSVPELEVALANCKDIFERTAATKYHMKGLDCD